MKNSLFDAKLFLGRTNGGRTPVTYLLKETIFRQGDPADTLSHVQDGKVKLSVVSQQGKEAVIAILGTGDFFGEGCLAGQPLRMATASALTACTVMNLHKAEVVRVLHEEPTFSELFVAHLLSRNNKFPR